MKNAVKVGEAQTSKITFKKESKEQIETGMSQRFEKYTRRVNSVKINKISTILTKMRSVLEKKIVVESNKEKSNRNINHQTIPAKIRITLKRSHKRGLNSVISMTTH